MRRRRGIFLVEMLTVILMLGIGGTLIAVGLASVINSQKRVVAFGNQLARIEDFLACLRDDVRSVKAATLSGGDPRGPNYILQLGDPPHQISYRFFTERVERLTKDVTKEWTPMPSELSLVNPSQDGVGDGVTVGVWWRRSDSRDPEPDRRFDLLVRCAGALK